MEKLEPEEQLQTQAQAQAQVVVGELDDVNVAQQLDPETQALVQRCMDGTEPYGRELKYWEPKAFNPINIMTVMLASAGFKAVQIEEIQGIDKARISVILRHPYGRKILYAMMNRQGSRVLDIKTRLEEYASDLIDKVYIEAMAEKDLKISSAITFGLLDRAGYGVTTKVETKSTAVAVSASEHTMQRLASAMEGSNIVDSLVMPAWTPPAKPAEGQSVGTLDSAVPSGRQDADPLDSGQSSRQVSQPPAQPVSAVLPHPSLRKFA